MTPVTPVTPEISFQPADSLWRGACTKFIPVRLTRPSSTCGHVRCTRACNTCARLHRPVILSSAPLTLSLSKHLQPVHRHACATPFRTARSSCPISSSQLPAPAPLTDAAYRRNFRSADWTYAKRASFLNHSGSTGDGRTFLRAAARQLRGRRQRHPRRELLRCGAATGFSGAMPGCLQP